MRSRAAASIVLALLLLPACGPDAPDATTLAAWTTTRTQVDLPGASLGVVSGEVSGSCIVVGSAILHERVFSERFKRGLGCVFADTRIHAEGASAPDGGYGVEALLADIDAVRQHLGHERVMIVGHSIYGLMALEYARAYPDRVSHVVAVSPPARVGPEADATREKFWNERATDERKARYAESMAAFAAHVDELGPNETLEARLIAESPRILANPGRDASGLLEDVTFNAGLADALLADAAARSPFGEGEPLVVPVFIMLGQFDFIVPYTSWDASLGVMTNLFVDILPTTGHVPPLEDPGSFDDRLMTWLSFVR